MITDYQVIMSVNFTVNSSEHYESYNGSGNGEDQMFPITPPKSDQAGVESDQHDDYSEGPARKKVK